MRSWMALGVLWMTVQGTKPAHTMEVLDAVAGPAAEAGIYTMDAHVLVDATPTALRVVTTRLCEYREQMQHLSYCRVFKVDAKKSWSYALVELPVINPRDYVIESTIVQELKADGGGTYKSCWKAVTNAGPVPRKGVVRLTVNQGCWTMVPANHGQRTLVHYEVRLSPGGVIPAWAGGYAAKQTLPEYMRLLERLAKDADAAGVKPPDPEKPWAAAVVLPLDNPLPPPRPPLPMPPMP